MDKGKEPQSKESKRFHQAIADIAKGSAVLRATIPDDDSGSSYQEQESPFTKIPVSALCLKLAYQVWNDCQHTCGGPIPPQVIAQMMQQINGGEDQHGGKHMKVIVSKSPDETQGLLSALENFFSEQPPKQEEEEEEDEEEDEEEEK